MSENAETSEIFLSENIFNVKTFNIYIWKQHE